MKKLSISLAAMAGMIAGTAQATPVAIADLATAPIVQISGATAPDNTFASYLLLNEASGGIFEDDSIRRFTGSTDGDDFTITCGTPLSATVSGNSSTSAFEDASGSSATLSTSAPLCVQKVAHGSGQGTGEILAGSQLNFGDLSAIVGCASASTSDDDVASSSSTTTFGNSCTQNITTTTVAATSTDSAYILHAGFTGSEIEDTTVLADCGVADVEPALFFEDSADFDSTSIFDIPWGMQVSIPFYYALQHAQLSGDCIPGSTNYDTTDGTADGVAREAACVPSLRLSDVRSIFTGDLSDAREMLDETGYAIMDLTAVENQAGIDVTGAYSGNSTLQGGRENNSVVPVPAQVNSAYPIYLCRRKNSSGTQASYEAKFLRQRCMTGGGQMAAGDIAPGNTTSGGDGKAANFLGSNAGERVFANSGSSDVSECVTNATVQNVWAIGINSTEKVAENESSNGGKEGYAHVKIDGVLPTSLNVTTGYYPFFSSLSGNTRSGESTSGGAPELCREEIFDKAGLSSILVGVQSDFVHGFGQGGPMASADKSANSLPLTTYAGGLSNAEYIANPVNNYSVSTSGQLNNCAEPTKIPSVLPGTNIPTIAGEIK
jgi:hypothetical protein